MNPIDHAISHVMNVIDQRLLKTAFPVESQYDISTLESRIRQRIVRGRVLMDLNIASGRRATVEVGKCKSSYHTDGSLILSVPPEQIQNAEILQPMEMMFLKPQGNLFIGVRAVNTMDAAFIRMLDGNTVHQVGDSDLIKLDSNTIWCRNISAASNFAVLNLMITNDAELRNLHVTLYTLFAQIVENATKSYLYSQRFSMQSANIFGGFDQSQYENMVGEYSGAEELYIEMTGKRWKIACQLTDPARKRAHIQGLTPYG